MKRNAFLDKIETRIEREKLEAQRFTRQLMADLLAIALNSEMGIGAERLEQINKKWAALFDEYATLWNSDTPDAEYSRETLDRKLKQIYGDKFVPWEDRYAF